MPLTTLDPSPALIVIDPQKGMVNGSFIHPIGEVIDRTRVLIDVFRARNLPVVLVNVAGRAPGRTETGSAQQPIVFRGMDRPFAAARSATERYGRQEAQLGRIRDNGSLNASSRRVALPRWL